VEEEEKEERVASSPPHWVTIDANEFCLWTPVPSSSLEKSIRFM
jgi:hypothetical protein